MTHAMTPLPGPNALKRPASLQNLPAGVETILLVDDEDGVRRPVRRVLERQGYVVLEAQSGDQALDLLRAGGADIALVVCDLAMPGMTGLDLIKRIGAGARPRILLMSGYPDESIRAFGGIPAGVGFLSKPFTLGALITEVRALLDSSTLV
ncbi:MAG: response regulator [Gemmatimonadota bacterium]